LERDRVFKLAVLGSASAIKDSPEAARAFSVGELIASRGGILLTGGCPGLPHAAVRGAASAGGLTIAISPATNRDEHRGIYSYPVDSHAIVFTGMGTKGRNVILIRSADACVFTDGGIGTLNEFTIAFDELGPRNAIGLLTGAGGLIDEFPRLASLTERTPRAFLVEESDPHRLVDLLFRHIETA